MLWLNYFSLRIGEMENVAELLVGMAAEAKIATIVRCFTQKTTGERMLKITKRLGEITIEQDETAGMAYMETNS